MRNVTLGLIIGAALLVSGSLSLKATENKMKLWYDKPADEWMKMNNVYFKFFILKTV